jgi:hypothetical protein
METITDFLFQQTSLTLDESAINANLTSDNNTNDDDVVEVQNSNSPELSALKPQIIPQPLQIIGPLTTTVTIVSELINSLETETNEPSNNTPTGNFQPVNACRQMPATPPPAANNVMLKYNYMPDSGTISKHQPPVDTPFTGIYIFT